MAKATKNTETQKDEPTAEEKQPVQPALKHKEIVFIGHINAVDIYGYNSQEILDMADKCYSFYGQTPTIQLSGEVLVGDAIIRLRQESAVYKNVTNDDWHLPFMGVDVSPINGTIVKARVGIHKQNMLENWEQTPERQTYRAKLLDALKK